MRNRRCAGWLVVFVAACFNPVPNPRCGLDRECPNGLTCSANLICESTSDADIDAPPDTPLCFGMFPQICFDAAGDLPTGPMMIPDQADIELDTGTSPLCHTANNLASDYCVITGTSYTLRSGNTVTAYGDKPLVLLLTTTIDLQGTLNVRSVKTGQLPRGAGANSPSCSTGTSAQGGGGGGGGSFGGKGGNGERVDVDQGGQAAVASSPPSTLRGGCRGGDGDTGGVAGGVGGHGGGAVAIIAPQIQITGGRINASGAGGAAGVAIKNGGGGGGSGGMIVLDASTIAGTGTLLANGGGGGQGGPTGAPGGEPAESTMAAPGGRNNPNTDGGAGGDGSFGTTPNGRPGGTSAGMGGGGGGGGGTGFIRVRTPLPAGIVTAPSAIDLPAAAAP